MTSAWTSLLWKEWRAIRWKLALILAVCVLAPAPLAWQGGEEYFGGLAATVMIFVPLAAMGIAADIAAGEQSRRTIDFLQAQPTPIAKAAAAKLLAGTTVVVLPAVVAMAALWAIDWSRNGELASSRMLGWPLLAATLALTALSFFLWTAAAGVNASDEVRATAQGLVVIAAIWLAVVFAGHLTTESIDDHWPRSLRLAASAAPGSPAGVFSLTGDGEFVRDEYGWPDNIVAKSWPFVAIMVLSHGALAAWFVRRFGRIAKPQVGGDAISVSAPRGWLAPPRRTPLTAIIWKQLRESKPLALTGFAAILGLVAITAIVIKRLEAGEIVGSVADATMGCWATLGFAVAVVSGIGVFLDDLRPGLHTFWRSRPIAVDQWFFAKLLTGLLITIIPLAAAPLAVLAALHLAYDFTVTGDDAATLIAIPIFHASGFLVAVAAIVLLRGAAAAALATIAAAILFATTASYYRSDLTSAIVLGAIASMTATIVAWTALRNDWGWKS